MKQKYYILTCQCSDTNVWFSTIAASPEPLEKRRQKALDDGKGSCEVEEREFDNFFCMKHWGSPTDFLIHDGFHNLGESHNMRGETLGCLWCLKEHAEHPEVVEALEARLEKEGSDQNWYYSRPWV